MHSTYTYGVKFYSARKNEKHEVTMLWKFDALLGATEH